MRYGVNVPHLGSSATKDGVIRGVRRAEELGYDAVWALDRLLSPTDPRDPYPGTPDERLWPAYFQRNLDPLETLTFAAAHSERIRLGTAVLDIPFYNPVVLGRRLASLDVFSEGRLNVGLGLGYSRDEFVAAGTSGQHRGRRADEFVQLLRDVWTEDPVRHDGEFFTVPESTIALKPVQRPHPPIYLAAYAPGALRRIARLGDGWLPSGFPLDDLEAGIRQLRGFASDAGRDPGQLEVLAVYDAEPTERPQGADRAPLVGSPEQIAEDLTRLEAIGVSEVVFELPFGRSTDDLLELMSRLAAVRP